MNKSNQVLRNRLLSNMEEFDDKQSINIQQSVPILNSAKVLRILISLDQTKQKIKQGQITQGRYKQQAKFVYFLWKAIGKQFIKVQTFKYIILELQQSNHFLQLAKNLQYVVSNCEQSTIKKLFDSWSKLKQDRQYYQSIKKQKKHRNQRTQSKNQSSQKHKQQLLKENFSLNLMNKTLKNIKERRQRQRSSSNNNSCKNLFNLNFANQMSMSIQTSPKNTIKFKSKLKTKHQPQFMEKKIGLKTREHLKTETNDAYYFKTEENQNQQGENFDTSPNPKLNSNQQKLLIQRLYENKKYQEREQIKNKFKTEVQQQQLKSCTFKPELITQTQKGKKLLKSSSRSKDISRINGFEKAVTRMKVGQSKSKVKKELEEYYSVGENYQKIKQKPINPPSFLNRNQNQPPKVVLFMIQFQLGRHKVKVKIHPTDTEVSVAKKLSKIYGLKKDQQQQIKEILGRQLNNYYRQMNSCCGQTKQFQQNDTISISTYKKQLCKNDNDNQQFTLQCQKDQITEFNQLFKRIKNQ